MQRLGALGFLGCCENLAMATAPMYGALVAKYFSWRAPSLTLSSLFLAYRS